MFIFSMLVLIRHLWQLETVVFLHWCLIHAPILSQFFVNKITSNMEGGKVYHQKFYIHSRGI